MTKSCDLCLSNINNLFVLLRELGVISQNDVKLLSEVVFDIVSGESSRERHARVRGRVSTHLINRRIE